MIGIRSNSRDKSTTRGLDGKWLYIKLLEVQMVSKPEEGTEKAIFDTYQLQIDNILRRW